MRLSEGSPVRLGATWDGRGTNFALFSAHAEKIELCLFDSQGRREIDRVALPERTEDVWHGYLADVTPGQLYGYRVHGPYEPEKGHRFNAHKLLLDPYAKRLAGRLVWSDAHFGYRPGSPRQDLSFDRRDNARGMPKAVVTDETFNRERREPRPSIPWEDTIIYEAHVKGLTKTREDVPPGLRGGYRALAAPSMIDHLKRLGVTTIELLPVHGFVDDRQLVERKLVELLGLQFDRLLRAGAALRAERRTGRASHGCRTAARCRLRGAARRRLQSYGRRQSPRPNAVVSWHRQRVLLLAVAGKQPLLRRFHRLRKLTRPHQYTRRCRW